MDLETSDDWELGPTDFEDHYEKPSSLKNLIIVQSYCRRYLCQRGFKTLIKQFRKRGRIADEILSTERTYVKSLAECKATFMDQLMFNITTSNNSFCSKSQYDQIFGQLALILEVNRTLLESIEKEMKTWNPTSTTIGHIFLKLTPYLKSYTTYCSNYENAQKAVSELQKDKIGGEWLKRQSQITSVAILSYLIMPVQRIPRYNMLLADLVKNTWPFHPDYADLSTALLKVQAVAGQVNEGIRRAEKMQKIVEIQNQINSGDPPILVAPHRVFVKEGILLKPKKRWIFLFNDMLVYCKINSEQKRHFGYKGDIYLGNAWINSLTEEEEAAQQLKFAFQIVAPKKTYTYSAETAKEKDTWIEALNQVIDDLVAQNPNLIKQRANVKQRSSKMQKFKLKFGGGTSDALDPRPYSLNKIGFYIDHISEGPLNTCPSLISKTFTSSSAHKFLLDTPNVTEIVKKKQSSNKKKAPKRSLSTLPPLEVAKEVPQPSLGSILAPEHTGFLTKRGGSFKDWKERYFVLKEHFFYYYAGKGNKTLPSGIVGLDGYTFQPDPSGSGKNRFSFTLTQPGARQWYIYAKSEKLYDSWKDILSQQCIELVESKPPPPPIEAEDTNSGLRRTFSGAIKKARSNTLENTPSSGSGSGIATSTSSKSPESPTDSPLLSPKKGKSQKSWLRRSSSSSSMKKSGSAVNLRKSALKSNSFDEETSPMLIDTVTTSSGDFGDLLPQSSLPFSPYFLLKKQLTISSEAVPLAVGGLLYGKFKDIEPNLQACRQLIQYAKGNAERAAEVVKHHPIKPLLHLMMRPESVIVDHATLALYYLTFHDKSSNLEARTECRTEGTELLIDMLHDGNRQLVTQHAQDLAARILVNCHLSDSSILAVGADDTRVIPALIALVKHAKEKLCTHAIIALSDISQQFYVRSLEQSKMVHLFLTVKNSFAAVLAEIKKDPDDLQQRIRQFHLCRIVGHICYDIPKQVSFLDLLTASLARSPPPAIQTAALQSIAIFAKERSGRLYIGQHVGLPGIISCISEETTDIQVLREASNIIKMFACDPLSRNTLLDLGALPPLVGLLKSPDREVLINVTKAVGAVADKSNIRDAIRNLNALPSLFSLLINSKDETILEGACLVLAHITETFQPNRTILLQAGCLEIILNLLKTCKSTGLVENLLKIIRNMALDDEPRKKLLSLGVLTSMSVYLLPHLPLFVFKAAANALVPLLATSDSSDLLIQTKIVESLLKRIPEINPDAPVVILNVLSTILTTTPEKAGNSIIVPPEILNNIRKFTSSVDPQLSKSSTKFLSVYNRSKSSGAARARSGSMLVPDMELEGTTSTTQSESNPLAPTDSPKQSDQLLASLDF